MRRKRILIGLFHVFVAMAINKGKNIPWRRGEQLYTRRYLWPVLAGVGVSDVAYVAGFGQCRSQWVNFDLTQVPTQPLFLFVWLKTWMLRKV